MIICKNCKKEYEEKYFKSDFCSVKCANQYVGKQKILYISYLSLIQN